MALVDKAQVVKTLVVKALVVKALIVKALGVIQGAAAGDPAHLDLLRCMNGYGSVKSACVLFVNGYLSLLCFSLSFSLFVKV